MESEKPSREEKKRDEKKEARNEISKIDAKLFDNDFEIETRRSV